MFHFHHLITLWFTELVLQGNEDPLGGGGLFLRNSLRCMDFKVYSSAFFIHCDSMLFQVGLSFLVSNYKPFSFKPFKGSVRVQRSPNAPSVRMGLFDGVFGSKKARDDDILDRNFQQVKPMLSDARLDA